MNKPGVCAIVGFVLAGSVHALDWPQCGGENRNNVSAETGLADMWPDSGPKVLWETQVHDGYASPAVKNGKVYFVDREEGKSLLRCFDLESGKELWRCTFDDPGTMKGKKFAGTRGAPTVTDDDIYLMTGYGRLVCIDPSTRKVSWSRNLLEDQGLDLHQWGYAQSPSLSGNMLFVAIDGHVLAFARDSGERLWSSDKLGLHGYVSPQVYTLCGTDMVVAVGSNEEPPRKRNRKSDKDNKSKPPKKLQQGHVMGLSPKDGSILWDYTGWNCKMVIPHPVLASGNRLFITGGYDAGSALIRIKKTVGGYGVEELYKTDEVGSQIQQPVLAGDYLFIGSNSNSRKDGLACFSLDGRLKWRTKDVDGAPNFERGPLILADDKLIILDGKTGVLHLVKADISGYKELAAAKMVDENDMAWAPLALADGKLLVRDWNTLKCVDLRK